MTVDNESAGGFVFNSRVLETNRLEALRRYDILETPPEEAFDRLTELAAGIFDVSVAFVAFLDADRQWFKSAVGFDKKESSLAASFCTHTVEQEALMIVEDATKDDRFARSPFVTDAGLRFYAGVPLVTPDGHAIGTFSVMDRKPRGLCREKARWLETLAEMSISQLSLRQKNKKYEEATRQFNAVLEDPNMLAGVIAPDGTLLETNETSLKYVEECRDDVLGKPFWETPWWPDRLKDNIRAWVERAARGEYVTYEADLTGADGSSYSVEGTIRPVFEDDEVVSLVVSAQDVTARKRREQELERAKAEAEEAARLKSAMMANMSHEIRTPLTSVIGISEVLRSELDGQGQDLVEKIHRSGRRLMRTLDSVLQLSELETGTYRLSREPIRLERVTEETVELFYPEAEEKGVTLETMHSESVKGHWSEAALNRIVGNLIENAIKFTPAGGRVEVRTLTKATEGVLEVEDTGIGISEEALPDIFQAFKQESEGTEREFEGAGLGLSIVQRLVDVIGGSLEVETEKNQGTCFRVRLPRAGTAEG